MRGGVSCAAAALEIAEWAGRQRRCRGDGGRGRGEEACPARWRLPEAASRRCRCRRCRRCRDVGAREADRGAGGRGHGDRVPAGRRGGAGQAPQAQLPGGGEGNQPGRDRGDLPEFRVARGHRDHPDQPIAGRADPARGGGAHAPLPAVLEIPSKEHPYDPAKDSVLRRARGLFSPDELR